MGLFTVINLTTVRDLTLANIDISAPNAERVGALAGLMENAIIDNVHVTGSVSGLNDVGGIGGWVSDSVFSDVSSAANVTATGDRVGGLIGRSYYGLEITDAYVTGAVSGSNEVGGAHRAGDRRRRHADQRLCQRYRLGHIERRRADRPDIHLRPDPSLQYHTDGRLLGCDRVRPDGGDRHDRCWQCGDRRRR